MTEFGIFYQPAGPVGNRFNRFSTIAGCLCQPWGTPDLSLSGSHSSGFEIENHFFFLLPYSVRNFLAKFGIFYQPSELVGNRFNRFSTIAGYLCQPWGALDGLWAAVKVKLLHKSFSWIVQGWLISWPLIHDLRGFLFGWSSLIFT